MPGNYRVSPMLELRAEETLRHQPIAVSLGKIVKLSRRTLR